MMELDDFKQLWQGQNFAGDNSNQAGHESVSAIKQKVEKFNQTIFWRDIRESVVAVVLAGWFIYSAIITDQTMGKLGHYITSAACLFIAVFMYMKKAQHPEALPDEDMRSYLQKNLKRVKAQIWLLKNVVWWYIAPLLLSLIIRNIILQGMKMDLIILTTGFMLLGYFVYWLNQKAVKKYLLPLKSDIEESIKELEED